MQNGFYEGASMHCLQRVKWKIGPVYIFLFLFGAFFIFFTIYGFAFRGQTSLDVVPWVASRRGQMNIFYAPSDLFYSPFLLLFFFFSSFLFYEMLDVLFYGLICREERFDGDGENGVFFFCSINEIFSIRVNADSFSVFI